MAYPFNTSGGTCVPLQPLLPSLELPVQVISYFVFKYGSKRFPRRANHTMGWSVLVLVDLASFFGLFGESGHMRATRWSMAYHDSINEIKEKDAQGAGKSEELHLCTKGSETKRAHPESQQAETENAMGL